MATPGFRAIVGIVALIVFIALMVLIYRAAKAHNSDVKFPPSIPTCPDFFAASSSQEGSNDPGCILPNDLKNRDLIINNMKMSNSSQVNDVAAGKPLQIPSGNLCKFLKNNGLTWNGVSNVHPCMDV